MKDWAYSRLPGGFLFKPASIGEALNQAGTSLVAVLTSATDFSVSRVNLYKLGFLSRL